MKRREGEMEEQGSVVDQRKQASVASHEKK